MKDWQKGLLGGLFIGSFGMVPLALWLAEIKVTFHCPNCDSPITMWKERKEFLPQLRIDSQEEAENTEEAELAEESSLSIATAPTV